MNNLHYSLIGFGVAYFFISVIIFALAGKQIINKIKIFFGKNKDRAVVYELKNNRALREHIIKLDGDTLEIGEKNYNVSPSHVFISDNYDCKAVVVSENLKTSVDPKEANPSGLDMKTITNLIKRSKSIGRQEALEFIQRITKLAPLVFIGLGLISLLQLFFLYNIWTQMNGGRII